MQGQGFAAVWDVAVLLAKAAALPHSVGYTGCKPGGIKWMRLKLSGAWL